MNSKILYIFLLLIKLSTCARILGIFPLAARSHQILDESLMRGLVGAGHDVTVISPLKYNIPTKSGSYKHIVLTGFKEDFQARLEKMDLFKEKDVNLFLQITNKYRAVVPISTAVLNHTNVQKLLNDPNETFDLIIVEYFLNEILNYFSYHYKAPLIYLSTTGNPGWINPIIGNPTPVAYLPHVLSSYSQTMSFFERMHNSLLILYDNLITSLIFLPAQNKALHDIFPNAPDINNLSNVSLVLLNTHTSLNQAFPSIPNMIDIGGYHINPPNKLDDDLQNILDKAKNGVVYFSLGSNAQSKNLPEKKRDILLSVFSKLDQIVLWKWEDEYLPGQPSNVVVRKWMPQNDILAHSNIKLFITHGGQLSTAEAVYHGIPTLTMPIFGDQYLNARHAELSGYSRTLGFHESNFTESRILDLIGDLLNNPKYGKIVRQKSDIFHDRPLKPMESAIFWVEYVIRHSGADHLQVAGLTMPWHQYLLLDVILFITIALLTPAAIGYFFLKNVLMKNTTTKNKTE